jgi:hypothetical protein
MMARQKISDWIHAALAFVWPFLYLFPYVLVIHGQYLQIGNDFYPYYYKYKVYLLSSLSSFHFPLWSPSEAAGYPFYSDSFSQVLYPLNLPLLLFYRIVHGLTYLDYQRFMVLGIAIFAVGVYVWMRSLHVQMRPALFVALVMATSFKIVEITRDPNAVDSACWYPWILYAITKIVSSSSTRQKVLQGILLAFSGFSLITAGYPYFLYYSFFLIIPYGILILIPGLRKRLFNFGDDHPLQTWITLGIVGFFLLASTSPYLVQVSQLLKQTTDRGGGNFQYSTLNLFNFDNSLGSLVYPLESRAEGWYHFGFVGLFLILVFLFTRTKRKDPASHASASGTIVKWVLIAWIMLISYITYGRESLLFDFLWQVLPGFSSLREWGKMNIILVPLFAWLLALAYQYFEEIVAPADKTSGDTAASVRRGLWVLGGSLLGVLGIQGYFISLRMHDRYWTAYFLGDFIHAIPTALQKSHWMLSVGQLNHLFIILFVLLGLLSFSACLYFLWKAGRSRSYSPYVVLGIFVLLTTVNTFIVGPWMWTAGWADVPQRQPLDILTADVQSWNTPRTNNPDTITLSSAFNVGIIPSWYFARYSAFYSEAMKSEPAAAKTLMGGDTGEKIYFSTTITPASVQAFLNDAGRFPQSVQVNAYDGDFLDLTAYAPVNGYLSFIDNWDPNWMATVDGHRVAMLLLFGTFKSLQVSEGSHRVIFAYCPPLFRIANPACRLMR